MAAYCICESYGGARIYQFSLSALAIHFVMVGQMFSIDLCRLLCGEFVGFLNFYDSVICATNICE
jgi:hypothetical protein